MDILKSDDLNFDYRSGNVDEEGILIFVHQSLKDIIFSKAGNLYLQRLMACSGQQD